MRHPRYALAWVVAVTVVGLMILAVYYVSTSAAASPVAETEIHDLVANPQTSISN